MKVSASGQVMTEGTFHASAFSEGQGGGLHLAGQSDGIALQAHLTVESAEVIQEGENTVAVVKSAPGLSGFIKKTILGKSWKTWHGVAVCKLIQNATKDRTDFVFDFVDKTSNQIVCHLEGPLQGTTIIEP